MQDKLCICIKKPFSMHQPFSSQKGIFVSTTALDLAQYYSVDRSTQKRVSYGTTLPPHSECISCLPYKHNLLYMIILVKQRIKIENIFRIPNYA